MVDYFEEGGQLPNHQGEETGDEHGVHQANEYGRVGVVLVPILRCQHFLLVSVSLQSSLDLNIDKNEEYGLVQHVNGRECDTDLVFRSELCL